MTKFANANELKAWLLEQCVDADDATHAAPLLFPKGYNRPSTLFNVTASILIDEGVSKPIAVAISNQLKAEDSLALENKTPFSLANWNITGAPPAELKFNTLLNDVHSAIVKHADELGLEIEQPQEEVVLSRAMECYFVRHSDTAAVLPVSYTQKEQAGPQIFIHFTAKEASECPPLIASRFEHELTHAIRYLYAVQQNESAKKEGKKRVLPAHESTPQRHELKIKQESSLLYKELYKLTGEDFHSGYLIEHILNQGVIVGLAYTKLCIDDGPNIVAKYALVKKVTRVNPEIDLMEAQLWSVGTKTFDGVWKVYTFQGNRITRHSDGKY